MQPLPPSDNHRLLAAQGWFELGNHLEANEELEKIDAKLRAHPDVLGVRFMIYEKAKKYDACVDIGEALMRLDGGNVAHWLNQADVLASMGDVQKAHDLMLVAANGFPQVWHIRYVLACCSCRLGRVREGRAWLMEAMELESSPELKLKALEDPDLETIWRDPFDAL